MHTIGLILLKEKRFILKISLLLISLSDTKTELTLVTSCIIDPFLCCHLLYLIIYLDDSKFLQIKQQLKIDIKVAFKMNGKLREKSLKVQFYNK